MSTEYLLSYTHRCGGESGLCPEEKTDVFDTLDQLRAAYHDILTEMAADRLDWEERRRHWHSADPRWETDRWNFTFSVCETHVLPESSALRAEGENHFLHAYGVAVDAHTKGRAAARHAQELQERAQLAALKARYEKEPNGR